MKYHRFSLKIAFGCFVLLCFTVSANAANGLNCYIYGMHDYNDTVRNLLTYNSEVRGWVLVLQSLDGYTGGVNSDVVNAANAGLGVVVRMHWGYDPNGTLPPSSQYGTYASRAATYCQTHQNYCQYYIVGNESNLCSEWPRVSGGDGKCSDTDIREKISPSRYADCFQQTYNAVHAVAPNVKLVLSPAATWAGSFTYPPFDTFDFICYTTTLYTLIPHNMIGGMAFHPKTHIHDPAEITNNTLHDQPVFGCGHNESVHWYFRVYQDEMAKIPTDLVDRAIFLTELNPHEPSYGGWTNNNNGYVRAAYNEVNSWNSTHSTKKVTAMMLYRWDDGVDVWDIWNKTGVHQDLQQAVAFGQTSNGCGGPAPSTNTPGPSPTNTPTTGSCGSLISNGKTASADSTFSANYPGSKLTDGLWNGDFTRWVSGSAGDSHHWCYIDLGAGYNVCQILVYSDEAWNGNSELQYNPVKYTVRGSATGSGAVNTWTTLATFDNPCGQVDYPGGVGDAHQTHQVSGTYRYVGLDITGSDSSCGPNVRVQELQVYGTSGSQPTNTPAPPTSTSTPTSPGPGSTNTPTSPSQPTPTSGGVCGTNPTNGNMEQNSGPSSIPTGWTAYGGNHLGCRNSGGLGSIAPYEGSWCIGNESYDDNQVGGIYRVYQVYNGTCAARVFVTMQSSSQTGEKLRIGIDQEGGTSSAGVDSWSAWATNASPYNTQWAEITTSQVTVTGGQVTIFLEHDLSSPGDIALGKFDQVRLAGDACPIGSGPTNTPVPPTNTPTNTNTATPIPPSFTPTPTTPQFSFTPTGTFTRTFTPTKTPTDPLAPTATATPTLRTALRLAPAATEVPYGGSLSLTVRLDAHGLPVRQVNSFISFDSAKLLFIGGVTNTSLFDNSLTTNNPAERNPGMIAFPAGANSDLTGDDLLVATLNFVCIQAGASALTFLTDGLTTTEVTRDDFSRLAVDLGNAQVTTLPQPTATDTPLVPVDTATPTMTAPPTFTSTVTLTHTPAATLGVHADLRMVPLSSQVGLGATTSVEIRLDANGLGVRQVNGFIRFATTVVSFQNGAVNSAIFNNIMTTMQPQERTPGIISFPAGTTADVISNDVLVATINLSANTQGVATLDFIAEGLQRTEVDDAALLQLPVELHNGQFEIALGVTPTDTPVPPTSTMTVPPTDTATFTVTPTGTVPPTPTMMDTFTPTDTHTLAPTATFTITPPPPPTSGPSPSATPTGMAVLRFAPQPAQVVLGNTITIEVRLDTNTLPVAQVMGFMTYDNTVLTFTGGATNKTLFNNTMITSNPAEHEPGVISFPAGAFSAIASNDTLVATLDFSTLSLGAANLVFLLQAPQKSEIDDLAFLALPAIFAPGVITVTDGSIPTDTPTDTPAQPTNTDTPVAVTDTPAPLTDTITPTNTQTATPTSTDTVAFTSTPTATNTATATTAITATATRPTDTPSPTVTNTPTSELTPTAPIGATVTPASTVQVSPSPAPDTPTESATPPPQATTTDTPAAVTPPPTLTPTLDFDINRDGRIDGWDLIDLLAWQPLAENEHMRLLYKYDTFRFSQVWHRPTPLPLPPTDTPTPVPSHTATPIPPAPTATAAPTLALSPTPLSGTAAVLSVYPDTGLYLSGDQVEIDIMLEPKGNAVTTVSCFLQFDLSRWTFQPNSSATNHQVFNQASLTNDPQIIDGVIDFTAVAGAPVSGDRVRLATLSFKAENSGETTLIFLTEALRRTVLRDAEYQEVACQLHHGNYTVAK